jgi:RNA polymerase sigma-70 factor (ECF subfamily)
METVLAAREFHLRLQQEIDRLPEKLRAVMQLSAVEKSSAADIADVLGISEGTVRSRLYLARKELFKVFCNETL